MKQTNISNMFKNPIMAYDGNKPIRQSELVCRVCNKPVTVRSFKDKEYPRMCGSCSCEAWLDDGLDGL